MSDGEEGSDPEGEIRRASLDEEVEVKPCPLTKEMIAGGLSMLCRIGNRKAHAYVKLDLMEKELTDISAIGGFVYVRFLDLSTNFISDLSPLGTLTELLWLKLDQNVVSTCKEQPFTELVFLQWLSLASNQLKDLVELVGPSLETLNLTGNAINRLTFQHDHFANLVTLELRGNQLESTDGIHLPNLQRLYLAQNSIKSLVGLNKLERLLVLHLRDNQLESLDGLSEEMACLQYLNVRGNLITDERGLRSLRSLSSTLRHLVLADNQIAELLDYRLSVLIIIPHLDRLDKEPVTGEERNEARRTIKELIEGEPTET